MEDVVLTIPEVAKYLKVSDTKLYAMVQRDEIPHIKFGRNVRIRQSDLLEWMRSQTRTAKTDTCSL